MKIGIVCYPTYGGSGVVATGLGHALAKANHEVHFISYSQPVRLDLFSQNIYYHEVAIVNYPLFVYPPYILSLAGKLVDVVKFNKLDVLHVHYALPHATAAILARQALESEGINIPIITTLHGTDINLMAKDQTLGPIISLAINQSDVVTAVSQSLTDNTNELFTIKKKIRVIPNFIDLARFKPHKMDHFKKAIAPDGERILVHTSNFRRLKRVDNVVRIFDKVAQKIDAKLLLVGDGPERQNVEKLCREIGRCDQIRFLGKQEAVHEILSVCDLFLMPSESESFGLAALEAMACKVPVISSDVGGIPELNINGVTGYTAHLDDVDQMAAYAIEILSNDTTLQTFRDNALKQAQKFELKNILPMYEQAYIDALAMKR